jgi:hypothetical protein
MNRANILIIYIANIYIFRMNRANIYMLSAFSCFLIVEQVYAGRVPSLAARFASSMVTLVHVGGIIYIL